MKFGPDGRLYACVQGTGGDEARRIAVLDPATRAVETVATDVNPNDLVVTRAGWIYFTDTAAGTVVRVPLSARGLTRPPPVAGGLRQPNGLTLNPDQSQLWVSEYGGTHVWNFLIAGDGTLRGGERYAELRTPTGRAESEGTAPPRTPRGGCM